MVAEGTTEGGATEPSFDFGGAVPQEVVAVNGMSIPVTDCSLSDLKYLVAENVNEGVAIEDSADILGRCASITNLSKFCASTFGIV